MYFPVRALQVDGGSEFAADFEQACRHRHLRLFALPPHSPKLNGTVERAPRTYTEEFYEVTPCSCQVTPLSQEPPIQNSSRTPRAFAKPSHTRLHRSSSFNGKSEKCYYSPGQVQLVARDSPLG